MNPETPEDSRSAADIIIGRCRRLDKAQAGQMKEAIRQVGVTSVAEANPAQLIQITSALALIEDGKPLDKLDATAMPSAIRQVADGLTRASVELARLADVLDEAF